MLQTIEDGDVSGLDDFDNRYLLGEKSFGIRREALKSLPVIDASPFVTGGIDTQRSASRKKFARRVLMWVSFT